MIAHSDDKEPIESSDRLVFGDDQPTDIALKLFQRFRRKYGGKTGSIVTPYLWNLYSWHHERTSKCLRKKPALEVFYRVTWWWATIFFINVYIMYLFKNL